MRPLELKSETLELNSVALELQSETLKLNRVALEFQTQTLERKIQKCMSKATPYNAKAKVNEANFVL